MVILPAGCSPMLISRKTRGFWLVAMFGRMMVLDGRSSRLHRKVRHFCGSLRDALRGRLEFMCSKTRSVGVCDNVDSPLTVSLEAECTHHVVARGNLLFSVRCMRFVRYLPYARHITCLSSLTRLGERHRGGKRKTMIGSIRPGAWQYERLSPYVKCSIHSFASQ